MTDNTKQTNDTKDVFMKCGTCSHAFGHLLNREFGNLADQEEAALDSLAGGAMNHGHKCEIICERITGKKFKDINDHSSHINEGGCATLIEVLSDPD